MKKSPFTVILTLAAGLVTVANAATILTSDGNGADTHVQLGNTTTNYGGDSAFLVKRANALTDGTNRKGYLRFDISSFSPGTGTAGNDVTSVSLRLAVATFGGGVATSVTFNLFGLTDAGADENFKETNPGGLTYGAATGLDTSADGIDNGSANFANSGNPLATFTVNSSDLNGYVTIAETPALLAFLNADQNNLVSFVLTRNSTTNGGNSNGDLNTAFASKEHATLGAPELLINVPEPSTGLLLFATLGLAVARRRR